MRFIPRKTKVKMEFFKGVTLTDILVAAIGVGGAFFFAISNLPYHWYFALAWICIIAMLFMPVDDELKLYGTIGLMIRFIAFKKKYNKDDIDKKTGKLRMREIIPYEGIIKDKFLDYKDYFGMVMEIQPIEFGLLDDNKQEMVVKSFANALRRLTPEQSASIIKTNKAIVFDDYVQCEDKKYDTLMELQYEGEMTEEEVQARADVFEARVSQIEYMNREEKIYKDYFYIIVYDKDKELLESTIDGMINTIGNSVVPMNSHKLIGKELAAFLRSTYGKDFDERDLESTPVDQFTNWSMPESIVFKTQKTVINKQAYRSFVLTDYPLQVPNAWGAHFFMIGGTNVVMNIKQQQKGPAERKIDRAIVEMEAKMANTLKSSKKLEQQTQLKTMKELLATLKSNNEQLFEMNTHILCEEGSKKEVRALLRQNGYKFSEMFGRQVDAFVSRNMSALDTVKNSLRDIPTTTLASVFPFISGALQDEKGFYIGYNEYPVFVNFFKRDRERANSNVMIIGKSGGGKSYATKTLLTNLACDNSKVFVLDPEDEYTPLSYNMKGKVMDVGSSMSGRFNPFHIFTTLQSDEGGEDDSYSVHLQFLEEFLSIILPGMPAEAFELLNAIVIEAYKEKGINSQTPLTKLKATDFPIFDDIYRLAQNRLKNAQDEYFRNNIQSVITYISKFATGGRNSNLWNGPTSIETKENFFTFNFRSLLANRNSLVANAQMLLVFKYLDNEIIKNKDFNDKYSANRHIIVVVDEAHVFINPQRPIALEFMAQMAKRIRKYGGMQIVITQNIKDFVGSPEIARQSTAIINACQYSFIFGLAPNDITDLIELYRNAGGINQEEQDSIVTASVGQCFLITGALSRTSVKIEANEAVIKLFS
ncbi:MAG: ATP-binding protein [Clostridia bacterium]|nr:ATP-binding protein [Clostridia bacterium]